MEKNYTPFAVKQNSLRGGGCGFSVQDESTIIQVKNQDVFDLFSKFSHYVQILESKASSAANLQESQEIMIAIQWFVLKEENIYQLNKYDQSVKKSYDLILDGIIRLLKSCLIYIRTDSFKCLYILQITTSLSKVIFSFHLMNDKRYMKCETQKSILEICQELKQQLEVERNDLIQNQVELYLRLTQVSFEIAPTDNTDRDEILKGCLKGLIISAISMSPDIDFFESLFEGACLLFKRLDIPKKRKQFEVYYQIDMMQWEIINYLKDDKGKNLEEIIMRIEGMYEALIKNSKNWHDHYLWIQMIGKILNYNPLVTKRSLGKLYSSKSIEIRSQSQIWKDYQNQGLLIQTNYDKDEAAILLYQLHNKKTLQFDRLILENFFKKWKNLLLLKEYLMNEQQENIPFTFGSYLKGQLQLENKGIDKQILPLKQIQKFLGFIISNKLINLVQQSHENLEKVDEIWREFVIDKQINFRISQSTYAQKLKRIISNLEGYFSVNQKIFKLLNLHQKNQCGSELFDNNEFIQFQQLKYQLKFLESLLQESIEERKDNQIQKNEILLKQKELLQKTLQACSQHKYKLQLIDHLQEMLNTLPSAKEKNFGQKSQRIIKLLQDSQKQIKNYEIQLLQNGDLIKYFQEFIEYLYLCYEQKNQELQKDQDHLMLCLKEIFILQHEIDAASKSQDLDHIKNTSFSETFQILLRSVQPEKLQKLEEAINFDKFLLDAIKNYPQRIMSCNNNEKKQINFNEEQNFDEVTENELKNKLSKQKGIVQFLLFKLNLEQKEIDSEKKDLELIENEFGELFEEQFSSSSEMKRIQQLLIKVPIDKSIKNLSGGHFDESQLKFEKEIYENLLTELKQIKFPQRVEQISEVINSTEILTETFKNSINKNVKIFIVPLCKRLRDLNDKVQKFKLYEEQLNKQESNIDRNKQEAKIDEQEQQLVNVQADKIEVIQTDQKNFIQQHLQNEMILQNENNLNLSKDDRQNLQNFDNQQIEKNKIIHNKKYLTNLQFLINIIRFKNSIIFQFKQLLEKLFVEFEQFASISDFILSQPSDIQYEMLIAFKSIIQNLRNNVESQLWIEVDQNYQRNENFHMHFEKILVSFSKFSETLDYKENKGIDQSVQENQCQQKINLHEFLHIMKDSSQKKLVQACHFSDEFLFEQEFIISQLQKLYLEDKEVEQLEEDLNQDLNIFDNFTQDWTDFKNNDEWKIKQGLVFTIIQISSNCFTNSLISFCQKTLIQLWIQEKDQRVRNILKNQALMSTQMQILQRDWKNQHDRIEGELQTMLIKIDDLQDEIAHEANLNKRDQQLKELDQTTQQLEEYISNISEMGQQLRLVTDFVNSLRKGLKRIEGKINEMKEQLNNIGNDVKFLRGKSVGQLLEIRKWKVLKRAALINVKSIYVPLKTIEKKSENEETVSNLMNLQQFNDKEGEVNEFLLEGKTVLLIHGTAGSGKSTTALKIEEFIWKFHDKNQTNVMLIPIYISLPTLKNPVYQAVEETLHQDEYGFDDLQLKECKEMLELKKFRFLLIMDSYDEMKLENIQKNLYISNKLFYNWSNPLVIFTTRSEIFSSTNYAEWFAPEDKKQLKEIKLKKFDESQKLEYLQKFTNLNIKMLIFEIYEWQIQIQNINGFDITRFEMTWELLENKLLKQQTLNTVKSELLLNEKLIKSILEFLKNDDFIALKNIDAIRSLNTNLSRLWSVQKYQNIMDTVNLDKLIETPYMMEIVVQALPLILEKASDIDNLKYNFIKNFSKIMQDTLKSHYLIQMFEQQKKSFREQINEIEQNSKIEQQITLVDLQILEEIDYPFASLEIWKVLEQNQTLAKFQLNQEFTGLKKDFLNIFGKINVSDHFLQGREVKKLEIQNERTIELICDALKEKNLTSFDFYREFIRQYHLKQIEKLRNLGKSINVDRFLHDLQQYSTKLAKLMSSKQLTQVQYKQQGLLFKDQSQEDEWLDKFFNDDGVDGTYKKDIRSCTLIQQKGQNFQFAHKSIQEYLIAADLFELFQWCENFDSRMFNVTIEILSKKDQKNNTLAFLQRERNLQDYDAIMKYCLDQQKRPFETKIKKIMDFIKSVYNHDFNQCNYSTDIYSQTRRFFINKVSKEKKIQQCLKFLVDLTAIDDSFGQCGSNAINFLVEMKVDLSKQSFQKIKIKNTSIAGGNFSNCNLSSSYFENVNINGVNLNGALLINCKWINLRIDELHKFIGHTDAVLSVCFSPDGATLASGSKDKTIRLWNVKTGAFKQQLDGHEGSVYSVCFSPDGTTLASGSRDGTICLWDVKTGVFKLQLAGHDGTVQSVSFSPDGATLASGSFDEKIRLWDVKTGAFKQQLDGHANTVKSICFSPDGTRLASGSNDETIFLWDVKTGALKQQLFGHKSYVLSVCFSPDGITLASGSSDATIRLWDVKTGTLKQQLDGHTNTVDSVSFSPDGETLVSGSGDATIRLWDVKTGVLKQQLDGHTNIVWSVCFSADGKTLASGSEDETIRLWDVKTDVLKQQSNGHTSYIMSVCFSPDWATLASGSDDRTIRFWDVKTGAFKQQLDGHTNTVKSICFSPDGAKLASGSDDQTIRLWDVNTGTLQQELNGHTSYVQSVCFSPNGAILASGSDDTTVRLWDMKTGAFKQQLGKHTEGISCVCFSPDSATSATSSGKTIRLWDVKTGTLIQQLNGHTSYAKPVCFSPDGTILASGSHDKTIRLWNANTGKFLYQLDGHTYHVWSLSFSPDGATLASGSYDQTIRLWDVKTGAFKQQLVGHTGTVWSICYSPDGETLASGSDDKTIRLWDVKPSTFKYQIDGHTDIVYSVCFSPDGTNLASLNGDTTICLWDFKTGELKYNLDEHTDIVRSLCFSPDGATLASGSCDQTIRLWDVNTGIVQYQLDGHTDAVCCIGFSPDGATLASGSCDKTFRIWDLKKRALKQQLDGHTGTVYSAFFSQSEQILAIDDNQPQKLNPPTNQQLSLPSLTIVLISPYFHFLISKALIIQGVFKNHLDMDLRLLFKQRGCSVFQNDKD